MPLILDGTKGETFPSWTTGTRPSTPSQGQTGYNTTLNTLEVYDGTNWRQNYLNSATAQASTSGTSIDFTGIPSWVKRITVMFYGVSSNGSSNWLVRLGTSGGITTSGYLGAGCYVGAATAGANSTAGFIFQIGGSAQIMHGSIILTLVDASTNKWAAQGSLADSSQAYIFFSAGSVALSGTATQVRLTTVNGTDAFDAGTINILYE